ncbi:hypothetical protein TrST_g2474 [Triparma strigata]|uniref:C3HC-type domain-containing protein n=1 Tax=Triparma strigata TaxID=1606541 RepID=A0A9W7E3Y5_9STRA|nr:hypothetical protein TrST_g2474 [Triparma strigata]
MEARLANALAQYSDALAHVGSAPNTQYADYVARLKTFELHLWFGKPAQLSPPACARLGWACSSEDMLSCAKCGSHLCVKIEESLPEDETDSLVAEFTKQLSWAHSSSCSWRFTSNPSSHSSFPEAQTTLQATTKRMEALASATNAIGGTDLNVSASAVMKFLSENPRVLDFPSNFPDSIVALGICGWEPLSYDPLDVSDDSGDSDATATAVTTALECQHCGIRANLSLANNTSDLPPPAKKSRLSIDTAPPSSPPSASLPPFDPIESHRYYCPVVTSDENEDQNAGWKMCCKNLQVPPPLCSTKDILEKAKDVIELVH